MCSPTISVTCTCTVLISMNKNNVLLLLRDIHNNNYSLINIIFIHGNEYD